MSDLISRQAAIDAAERQIKDCNPEHFIGQPKFIEYMDDEYIGSFGQWQFANGFNMGLTAAEVTTKQLPSAQPERKTGRWIKGGEQPYFRKHFEIVVCSECNKRGERRWHYCPNCGAKMEVDG